MSESTVHTIRVPRTARVVTRGTPTTAPTWWVVLHGYGQRADDFIRRCGPLAGPDRAVVAPEALSRFYVDGLDTHEEVGASWMTRVAREGEIADYVDYLDRTVDRMRADDPSPSIRVLGFSQGAATASRWALLGDTAVDRLVLWGGAPAHDLDLGAHADRLAAMAPTLVVGTDDPYVTPERRAAVRRRLAEHDVRVSVRTFDGGHRLDDAVLARLADRA
jgi:predicted esterase